VVKAFCLFACLQMVGELISTALRLPVPGALIGMVILLVWLSVWADLPEALASGADTLHQHLGLFFVPAGVSLAENIELIRAKGVVLLLIILVSTWLSIAVVGLFAQRMFCGRMRERASTSAEATEPVS
jgi:holin-like protein